jgi:hypothetical protein
MRTRLRLWCQMFKHGRYERWHTNDGKFRIAITRDRLTARTHYIYEIVW